MNAPRVVIMAGGSGGHIFPALAVADALREAGYQVVWFGSLGMETQILARQGIELIQIDIRGLRGAGWGQRLKLPVQLLRAVLHSVISLRRLRPVWVMGFGGFVSAPGGLAACLLRLPLVLHEQNAVLGLANRLLARWADLRLQAFPQAFGDYPAYQVGNPVRAPIAALHAQPRQPSEKSPLNLLILGGSLGAVAINQALPQAIDQLDPALRPQIWHQAGRGKSESTQAAYQHKQICARVDEFIEDMAQAYQWADLVICRAGASTLAELACAGVAAIVVPYPHHADRHQFKNAQWLQQQGGALIWQQQDSPAQLAQLIAQLSVQSQQRQAMARSAQASALPQATQAIIHQCLNHYKVAV